jgi:peptide/nickel transport system permease protein
MSTAASTLGDASGIETTQRSGLSRTAGRFRRSRPAMISVTILALLVIAAYIVPPVFGMDPLEQLRGARLLSPSSSHLFGTDEAGRDLLARCLTGLQISIQVALAAALMGGIIGTLIGYTAGYARGIVDSVLMRLMDTMLAFPNILMAIVVVAVLGSGVRNVTIALAITNIPLFARISRGAMLSELGQVYVESARSIGCSPIRIIFRHVAPNTIAPLVVQLALAMAFAILGEAALSYLGLGVQPPDPSLGNLLSAGQTYILSGSQYYVLFPAAILALLLFALNLLADATNDVIDPASRG